MAGFFVFVQEENLRFPARAKKEPIGKAVGFISRSQPDNGTGSGNYLLVCGPPQGHSPRQLKQ